MHVMWYSTGSIAVPAPVYMVLKVYYVEIGLESPEETTETKGLVSEKFLSGMHLYKMQKQGKDENTQEEDTGLQWNDGRKLRPKLPYTPVVYVA